MKGCGIRQTGKRRKPTVKGPRTGMHSSNAINRPEPTDFTNVLIIAI
jgi:hypothetical protein